VLAGLSVCREVGPAYRSLLPRRSSSVSTFSASWAGGADDVTDGSVIVGRLTLHVGDHEGYSRMHKMGPGRRVEMSGGPFVEYATPDEKLHGPLQGLTAGRFTSGSFVKRG
jgi:hypothetical protein